MPVQKSLETYWTHLVYLLISLTFFFLPLSITFYTLDFLLSFFFILSFLSANYLSFFLLFVYSSNGFRYFKGISYYFSSVFQFTLLINMYRKPHCILHFWIIIFSFLRVFPIQIVICTEVWVISSFLSSPGLFLVLYPISSVRWFRQSHVFHGYPLTSVSFPDLGGAFYVHFHNTPYLAFLYIYIHIYIFSGNNSAVFSP